MPITVRERRFLSQIDDYRLRIHQTGTPVPPWSKVNADFWHGTFTSGLVALARFRRHRKP